MHRRRGLRVTDPLRPAGNGTWRQSNRMYCPACGYAPDALGHHQPAPADPRAPQAGDYSICFNCGEVSVIEMSPLLGASMRAATTAELAEFAADPGNVDAVRRLHRFHSQRGDR